MLLLQVALVRVDLEPFSVSGWESSLCMINIVSSYTFSFL